MKKYEVINSPDISKELERARQFTYKYNKINPAKTQKRYKMLQNNLAHIGQNSYILSPFNCDIGTNISLGDNVFINYNAVFLDCVKITIGDHVRIAPNCSIYTVGHPLDYKIRRTNSYTFGEVIIGDDTWIGGNVTILPGVKIGKRCVIGAGAVVTKDIPDDSLAYGVPARVIRKLDNKPTKK